MQVLMFYLCAPVRMYQALWFNEHHSHECVQDNIIVLRRLHTWILLQSPRHWDAAGDSDRHALLYLMCMILLILLIGNSSSSQSNGCS